MSMLLLGSGSAGALPPSVVVGTITASGASSSADRYMRQPFTLSSAISLDAVEAIYRAAMTNTVITIRDAGGVSQGSVTLASVTASDTVYTKATFASRISLAAGSYFVDWDCPGGQFVLISTPTGVTGVISAGGAGLHDPTYPPATTVAVNYNCAIKLYA